MVKPPFSTSSTFTLLTPEENNTGFYVLDFVIGFLGILTGIFEVWLEGLSLGTAMLFTVSIFLILCGRKRVARERNMDETPLPLNYDRAITAQQGPKSPHTDPNSEEIVVETPQVERH